jgi:hypothetical protein
MPARAIATLLVLTWALAHPAATAAASWRAPTGGRVTDGFSFDRREAFAPGQHRGADFAAAPGAPVHAPCGGRVVVASRIGTSGGVITLACGRYRVSLLPLERITTTLGTRVTPGALVGAAGRSSGHDGIHLGVRRSGDELGYVDPVPFIRRSRHLPPFVALARARPTKPRPRSAERRRIAAELGAAAHAVPRPAPATGRHAAAPGPPLAPWPVWVGLGALLLAAVGRGITRPRREVRTRHRTTARRAALAHGTAARDDLPP